MCLLSVYPPGAEVNPQHLLNGLEVNDEGAGRGHSNGRRLTTDRRMDGERVLRGFLTYRASFPDEWAVFHSRLSTGSAACLENCHPVPVAGDDQSVVFHNGALPYGDWATADGASDTAIFAEESFPQLFADLDDPATFGMLESWAGPGNKLVILTANPRYARPCYIVNRDRFTEADGVLHSNRDFLGKGIGWGEELDDAQHVWRFNLPDRSRLRDETARRARVAAATKAR